MVKGTRVFSILIARDWTLLPLHLPFLEMDWRIYKSSNTRHRAFVKFTEIIKYFTRILESLAP